MWMCLPKGKEAINTTTKQHTQTHINIKPENECIDFCSFCLWHVAYIVVDSLS